MRLRCNIMLLKLLTFTILIVACHLDDNCMSADALGLAGVEADQTILAKKSSSSDSKCSDRYYSDCSPFFPSLDLNVDLELCQDICQASQTPDQVTQCDWFIFDTQELKCKMFSNYFVTMKDFFRTCSEVGGPTRHNDGTCMVESSPAECSPSSEVGCKGCDPNHLPCERVHDVDCSLVEEQPPLIPDGATSFDESKMACAAEHSFARWTPQSPFECTCWDSGERLCSKIAVDRNATLDQIDSCRSIDSGNSDIGIVIVGGLSGNDESTAMNSGETFPSRSCEIPNTPFPFVDHSLSILTPEDGSSTTLIACGGSLQMAGSECWSWTQGANTWQLYADLGNHRYSPKAISLGKQIL